MADGDTVSIRVGRVEKELGELRQEVKAGFEELRIALLGGYGGDGGIAGRITILERAELACRQWQAKHENEAAAIVKVYEERLGKAESRLSDAEDEIEKWRNRAIGFGAALTLTGTGVGALLMKLFGG